MLPTFKGRMKFDAQAIKIILLAEIEHRYGMKFKPEDIWLGLTHTGAESCSVEAFIELDGNLIAGRS